jgi:hypothetical protein
MRIARLNVLSLTIEGFFHFASQSRTFLMGPGLASSLVESFGAYLTNTKTINIFLFFLNHKTKKLTLWSTTPSLRPARCLQATHELPQ